MDAMKFVMLSEDQKVKKINEMLKTKSRKEISIYWNVTETFISYVICPYGYYYDSKKDNIADIKGAVISLPLPPKGKKVKNLAYYERDRSCICPLTFRPCNI